MGSGRRRDTASASTLLACTCESCIGTRGTYNPGAFIGEHPYFKQIPGTKPTQPLSIDVYWQVCKPLDVQWSDPQATKIQMGLCQDTAWTAHLDGQSAYVGLGTQLAPSLCGSSGLFS